MKSMNYYYMLKERFIKYYNPGVINKKYGRALTPWEWLTTGHKAGASHLYRSVGDVAAKSKKQPKTIMGILRPTQNAVRKLRKKPSTHNRNKSPNIPLFLTTLYRLLR